MGLFTGISDATSTQGGNYLKPGRHLLEIIVNRVKKSRKKQNLAFAEFTVLESTVHEVGDAVSLGRWPECSAFRRRCDLSDAGRPMVRPVTRPLRGHRLQADPADAAASARASAACATLRRPHGRRRAARPGRPDLSRSEAACSVDSQASALAVPQNLEQRKSPPPPNPRARVLRESVERLRRSTTSRATAIKGYPVGATACGCRCFATTTTS